MIKGLVRVALPVLAAAALLLGMVPAQARSLDDILKSGTLLVGVNPNYPPLAEYDAQNNLQGFDVDVSTQIAAMLGVKLELVTVNSPDRVPFVAAGKVDLVMGGMTRTPDRAKVIDFSVPIQTEATGVLTTADKSYKTWEDLNDPSVRLVETRGSIGAKFVQDNLPKAQLQIIDDIPEVIRILAQGRADAHINTLDLLGTYLKQYPQVHWKVLDAKINVSYDGIGLAKGNDSLRYWLNVALFELQKGGKIDAMYRKWFGEDMLEKIQPDPYF